MKRIILPLIADLGVLLGLTMTLIVHDWLAAAWAVACGCWVTDALVKAWQA